MTPIKRGTARRLGLDLPQDPAVYDEIDWSRVAVSMEDIARGMPAWQRTVWESFASPGRESRDVR